MAPPFRLFDDAHLVSLVLVAVLAALLLSLLPRASASARRGVRLALAGLLALGVLLEPVGAARGGWLDRQLLPLHLCDVAVMLSIWALVTLDLRAVEPLYFLSFSGTLPALITPELPVGFPSFRFIIYFVPHGLVILAVLVLVCALRRVPRAGAWLRMFLWLNLYAAFIGVVNWSLGTNFLYLARKPSGPTPFDWFGPWPWYILTLEAAFCSVFFLLDLPLRLLRRSAALPPAAMRAAA